MKMGRGGGVGGLDVTIQPWAAASRIKRSCATLAREPNPKTDSRASISRDSALIQV